MLNRNNPGIIILFLLFHFPLLYANVGTYKYGSGGMVYPVKNQDLSMIDEKIVIDVHRGYARGYNKYTHYPEENYDCDFYYMVYRCTYTFQNNGTAQDFLLAFPVKYGSYSVIPPSDPSNPQIADFQLKIDGLEKAYTRNFHSLNPNFPEMLYDEAYSFTVKAEKAKPVIVEVLYTVIQYGTIEAAEAATVYYILKSGATLAQPIKQAEITVQLHFPAEIKIIEKPGIYTIRNQKEDPFTVISWKLMNFLPQAELEVRILPEKGNIERETFESFILSCLGVRNDQILILPEKEQTPVFRELYERSLQYPALSYNLIGFILGDLNEHPERTPGQELVKQATDKIITQARQYYNQELQKTKQVLTAAESNPLNWRLHKKIVVFFDTFSIWNLLDHSHIEMDIFIRNLFIQELFGLYQQTDLFLLSHTVLEHLDAAIIPILDSLLAVQMDNSEEIIGFLTEYLPHFARIDFQNQREAKALLNEPPKTAFALNPVLKKKIADATLALWGKKNLDPTALMLAKLLNVMHRIFIVKPGAYVESRIPAFLIEERDLLRKAYYSLGNYYFGSQEELAIFYYKLALVYGQTSPLLDFLTDFGEMYGWGFTVFADVDSIVFPEKTNEELGLLKTIFGNAKSWWQDLEHFPRMPEEDLVVLFTPERLLRFNLQAWLREDVHDAPCYYLAYNTACAYSRIGKAEDAFQWLKVAIQLNRDLINLSKTDKDLEFLRENRKNDLNELLKSTTTCNVLSLQGRWYLF